ATRGLDVRDRARPQRPHAGDVVGRPGGARHQMTPLASTTITYTWSQAFADLGQIAPIATLTGFMLFAIVADSLGTAAYRWLYAEGGPAYSGFATGDNFALFFEMLFAILGILTVAISH